MRRRTVRVFLAPILPTGELTRIPLPETRSRTPVACALPVFLIFTVYLETLPLLILFGPFTVTLPILALSLTQSGSLPVNPSGQGIGSQFGGMPVVNSGQVGGSAIPLETQMLPAPLLTWSTVAQSAPPTEVESCVTL